MSKVKVKSVFVFPQSSRQGGVWLCLVRSYIILVEIDVDATEGYHCCGCFRPTDDWDSNDVLARE